MVYVYKNALPVGIDAHSSLWFLPRDHMHNTANAGKKLGF